MKIYPLNIPGVTTTLAMYLHPENDKCVSKQIREQGIWEPYETSLIVDYLGNGGVFLDIGANIGYYTVLAASIVGREGLVVAFEPDNDNFALLEQNLALNHMTNVRPICAAVSGHRGRGFLYRSTDNSGDHQLYDNGEGRSRMAADVVHGGDYVRSITRRVDFIKIDTQGSETGIVNGLSRIILSNREHLTMIVELWPYGLRKAGSSGHALLDMLADFDMPLYLIDHIGHRIYKVDRSCLDAWVAEVDADPANRGFVNLLILPAGE
ncbi:MAG: FkbM family methyltransferase [Thermodesulfobacteriota bacterium]|nr:FkbM family methyltransferase [Thermodesulfobacteriota bacterium]